MNDRKLQSVTLELRGASAYSRALRLVSGGSHDRRFHFNASLSKECCELESPNGWWALMTSFLLS